MAKCLKHGNELYRDSEGLLRCVECDFERTTFIRETTGIDWLDL